MFGAYKYCNYSNLILLLNFVKINFLLLDVYLLQYNIYIITIYILLHIYIITI